MSEVKKDGGGAGRNVMRALSAAALAFILVIIGFVGWVYSLGPLPLDELVGKEHPVTHAGGETVAIPLPHPSGASSWIHAPAHRLLLDRALDLIRLRLSSEIVGHSLGAA